MICLRFGLEALYDASFKTISKGWLELWFYWLLSGFQVYLSKCWNPYVTPGCTIQLDFFCSFLPYFGMLILSLPLLGLGSKSTSISPGFCVHKPRQYDPICWEWNLMTGFFAFFWVILWVDGIKNVGGVLQEAGDSESRTHTRSQV